MLQKDYSVRHPAATLTKRVELQRKLLEELESQSV